jgi:hypothetical protein
MKRNGLYAAAALAAALCVTSAANAATYLLDFTTVGNTDFGDITFTTAGPWTSPVTAVSGSIDGSAITGLSSYAGSDNTLYDTAPHVSYGGVSISTALDTFNFANVSGLILTKESVNPSGSQQDLETLVGAISAVPEPATWAAMLLGFGGIGAAMRSRRKLALA